MNYNEMLTNARNKMKLCKACPVCNGKACGNTIPGPGAKGRGDNAQRNYLAWQEIRINMDTICENRDIDTSFELFGKKFVAPIFAGPVAAINSHYSDYYNDLEYNDIIVRGCKEANICAFTGDGKLDEIMINACKSIEKNDGIGIPTIKPWDIETVKRKMSHANDADAFAIAMDIDAAGLPFLRNNNPPAGSKTVKDLKDIISYTNKPFILKGIMTVKGALKAIEAGASAIVVSNHGGRVLEDTPATAEVLEDICKAVNGKIKVLVDGGIRSGADIFKALALGADGVIIARPYVTALFGGEEEGIKLYTEKLRTELEDTMKMCGCFSLKDIKREHIFIK